MGDFVLNYPLISVCLPMKKIIFLRAFAATSSLLSAALAFAADPLLSLTPDHDTGIYKPGEPVTWTVDIKSGDRAGLTALPYRVSKDGGKAEAASGTIDLSAGPAKITASREDPGALRAEIKLPDPAKSLPIGVGGAVVSPEKIGPVCPAPADFDAFWKTKLDELAKVASNPQVEKIGTEGLRNAEGVDLYRVTLDNIRGTHARGLLARPAQGEKFPALLVVNFAGVYPLDKNMITSEAKEGWLALNINAHDLPPDESEAFYKDQKENALKNYIYFGNDDRDQSYFVRMFLGCVRGAEYLASRPDWNGKVLVVTGVSQGGLQSFATAALYPKITAVVTGVPAGADVYGATANPPHAVAWPYWLNNWGPRDRDPEKVKQTAGYFDTIYFAARIRCPALVGVGLLDNAACPWGVIAAYNAIPQPKELIVMPLADHHGSGGSQNAYFQEALKWKQALLKGQPLPIPPPKF